MTLTIGSLFSGIGGLELGLERAGLGPVLWQVEIDPFARSVLAKHWPDVTRYEDVTAVGAELGAVDLICGGFPCQDVSSAGKREGLAGSRSGLWHQFARIVGGLRPRWVVVENVASGARLWVDAVTRDLEQLGYESLPIPLSASDVGAPHRRARVFIVASNAHTQGQPAVPVDAEVARAPQPAADADGAELRDEQQRGPGGRSGEVRDGGEAELENDGWRSPEPDMVRVVHGVPRKLDGRRRSALGNSVVPQCAEVVGWVIRELEEARCAA